MEIKEEALIGYWNLSKTDPQITFTQPEDVSKYQLCVIKLIPIKDTTEPANMQKVKRELKNLANAVRRIK
jgi:hypothetical protein